MNKQNIPQPNEFIQKSRHIWITMIAVVLTAIIVGGGVYAWQKSNLLSTEQSLQQQISDLRDQITNLRESTQPSVTSPEETQEATKEEPEQTVSIKKTFSPKNLSSVSIQHEDTWTQGEIDIIKKIGGRTYRISFQSNDEEYLVKGGPYARDLKLFEEVSVNGKTHYVFTAANEYGHISSCVVKPDEACSPRLSNGGYLFVLFHQHVAGAQYPVELDFSRTDDKQILTEFADIMTTLKY